MNRTVRIVTIVIVIDVTDINGLADITVGFSVKRGNDLF